MSERHPATAAAWAWLEQSGLIETDSARHERIVAALTTIDETFNRWDADRSAGHTGET